MVQTTCVFVPVVYHPEGSSLPYMLELDGFRDTVKKAEFPDPDDISSEEETGVFLLDTSVCIVITCYHNLQTIGVHIHCQIGENEAFWKLERGSGELYDIVRNILNTMKL